MPLKGGFQGIMIRRTIATLRLNGDLTYSTRSMGTKGWQAGVRSVAHRAPLWMGSAQGHVVEGCAGGVMGWNVIYAR